jgi:hypothetical protein
MWFACYTQEEIAEAVELSPEAVRLQLEKSQELENFPKLGFTPRPPGAHYTTKP